MLKYKTKLKVQREAEQTSHIHEDEVQMSFRGAREREIQI